MLGAYKARAVPFNVNYRYVAEELEYLFADAQAKGIIYHSAFAPTLDVVRVETFGPVLPIVAVDSDEEALALINDSDLGLTASVWTRDRDRAAHLAARIETGTVYMNQCDTLDPALPWTWVKDSGKGATLSALGFQHLTRPKAYNFKL